MDLFPTLTDLAGLAAPVGLVPPLAGHSLASIIRNPTKSAPLRKYALTQFSRCPITASEFHRDIQGKGPLIMQGRVSVDYRTRPDRGAQVGNWECAWKGWEWSLHHDLVLMGYSLRSYKWRYTAWVLWDSNTTLPVWTYPPFGEELYAHAMGTREVNLKLNRKKSFVSIFEMIQFSASLPSCVENFHILDSLLAPSTILKPLIC